MVILVSSASIYLWYLIFSHQFQVGYVFRYTSRDLGLGYLFSAFWAGQEGSFLFWALMIALLGIALMRTAQHLESYSMAILNIVQAGFLIILIKASPFSVTAGIPPDGAGLNPLLQNPWMVIHPPILFLGYAAVTLPFVIALAAILKHDFQQWVKIAFPWTLFASVTLGSGIIIGGFWAYEVLGWGGYWGWDPVENSSLIAWIVVLALFHSLIITRRNSALQKTSLALAIISFVLVLYATFLTRSGILADFSVHSFQDLGINNYLIIYMAVSLIFSLGLLVYHKDRIPNVKLKLSEFTKESALIGSLFMLLLSAATILIGTSSPIISSILGQPSQVQTGFYNTLNMPIAILMVILLSIAPLLSWKKENIRGIIRRNALPLVIFHLALIVSYFIGLTSSRAILLLSFSASAIVSNVIVFSRKSQTSIKSIAGPLTHLGFGLLLVGIVISGYFSENERGVLTKGQKAKILDISLSYEKNFTSPDGKNGILINVEDSSKVYTARPRLYYNESTRNEMREPDVHRSLFSDVYISPLQKMENQKESSNNLMQIKKGQKKLYAGFEFEFLSFEMNSHQNEGGILVGANIIIRNENKEYEITPAISMAGKDRKSIPADLHLADHRNVRIVLAGINADQKLITLQIHGLNKESEKDNNSEVDTKVLVEVSRKPFMNVLWLGSIILTIGTAIAFYRRWEHLNDKN